MMLSAPRAGSPDLPRSRCCHSWCRRSGCPKSPGAYSAFQIAVIAGPAVGGFLYAGPVAAYAVCTGALSSHWDWGSRLCGRRLVRQVTETSAVKRVIEGIRFVRQRPAGRHLARPVASWVAPQRCCRSTPATCMLVRLGLACCAAHRRSGRRSSRCRFGRRPLESEDGRQDVRDAVAILASRPSSSAFPPTCICRSRCCSCWAHPTW